MRHVITVFCVLFCSAAVVGCAEKADTAYEESATTASENPYAAYAGDWMTEVYSMEGGDPLVVVLVKATDSAEGWSMKFTHLDEAVPATNVFMKGDSVVMQIGAYPSALREGAMVKSIASYLKADGESMSGRFSAVYENGDKLHGRMTSERVD